MAHDIVVTRDRVLGVIDQFLSHVDFSDGEHGCWTWTGYRDRQGYGRFTATFGRGQQVNFKAHRFAWAIWRDNDLSRPDRCIDHIGCDNPACVNPEHLRMTTWRENLLRSDKTNAGKHARQTHCKHGHPLSGDNLYVYTWRKPNGKTYRMRQCKACRTKGASS